MADQRCREEYIRRIHKVQDYIEEHIGQPMTIEALATAAGFSPFHFSRIFQGILHEPLAHYVMRIRMERALFFLAHRSDLNMTDIALQLGYSDSAVFSRAFKNCYSMSPREYRQEYSKNCKETFLLSDYNKNTTAEEKRSQSSPVSGKIRIETIRERKAVYVRHTGTYETLGQEYGRLMEILFGQAAKQQLLVDGENWILAMYHDNPEFGEADQFRTSICLTIPDDKYVYEDGVLGVMTIEGGQYAIGHFRIRQDQYGDAWDYMYQEWVSGSGYVPRDYAPFEVYRNNASTSVDHMHEVDIYLPIERIHF